MDRELQFRLAQRQHDDELFRGDDEREEPQEPDYDSMLDAMETDRLVEAE